MESSGSSLHWALHSLLSQLKLYVRLTIKKLVILLDCPGRIGIMNVRWVRDILSLLFPSAPWPTFNRIPGGPQQRVRCRQVSRTDRNREGLPGPPSQPYGKTPGIHRPKDHGARQPALRRQELNFALDVRVVKAYIMDCRKKPFGETQNVQTK